MILLKLVQNTQKHGWDTPEKAIKGGADFIHQHFLSHDDQNTLYSMRWNPKIQVNINMLLILNGQKVMLKSSDFYKEMKTEGKYFKLYVYKDDNKHQK